MLGSKDVHLSEHCDNESFMESELQQVRLVCIKLLQAQSSTIRFLFVT